MAIVQRPLIFISHKHSDRAIATVVRGFITEQTASKVPVFQSSDPTARTPGVGKPLNAELCQALWSAGAVFLVYTSPDQDWAYCMWECGVAMLPNSPETCIAVLYCGDSAPSVFDGQLNVDLRSKSSVATFVTQFMTKPDFIPRMGEPLTGYDQTSPQVEQVANRFYGDLQAVIPEVAGVEWPTHPFLQLQLPNASGKTIGEAPAESRQTVTKEVVLSQGTISDCDKYARALFGLMDVGKDTTLKELYDTWRSAYKDSSDAWIDSLTHQVGRASQSQFPVLKWTAMPSVEDGRARVPVLTRVRKIPASHQFDVYFYPFNLLDATPVQGAMRRRQDMFCRVLEPDGETKMTVLELIDELETHRYSRMPFIDGGDRLVYIAHRSMLDQFIARQIRKRKADDLPKVTLAEMFAEDPQLKAMFSSTAAFIGIHATLAEAKAAMSTVKNCYDVFVTQSGTAQEPVLGWLTDVKIAASEG